MRRPAETGAKKWLVYARFITIFIVTMASVQLGMHLLFH